MKYMLENHQEVSRLAKQAKLKQYSIEDEFSEIQFKKGEKVLEVGCGGGDVINYINETWSVSAAGCDLLPSHINHCLNQNNTGINFFVHDITKSALDEKFDSIVLRYVAQHLPQDILKIAIGNIKKSLRPNGRLIIIDLDGMLSNFWCDDSFVNESIDKIIEGFPGDLSVGRKLGTLLSREGFQFDCKTQDCQFKSLNDKAKEAYQWEQRFSFAKELVIESLGNEVFYRRFLKKFLFEFKQNSSTYYFTKFIYVARSL